MSAALTAALLSSIPLVAVATASPAGAGAVVTTDPTTPIALTSLNGRTVPPGLLTVWTEVPWSPYWSDSTQDGRTSVLPSAKQALAGGGYRITWSLDVSNLNGKRTTFTMTSTRPGKTDDVEKASFRVSGAPTARSVGPLGAAVPGATVQPLSGGSGTPRAPMATAASDDLVVRAQLAADSTGSAFSTTGTDSGVAASRLLGSADATGTDARVVVRDSTIAVAASRAAVSGSAATVDGSVLTSATDGVNPVGGARGLPTTISNSRLMRDGTAPTSAHNDGVQLWQGGQVTITGDWITGWAASAVMIKSDLEQVPGDGPITDVTVTDNYLANPTGAYVLYVADGGKGLPQYVTVTGNLFGPSRSGALYPVSGQTFVRTADERTRAVADGVPGAAAWVVWNDNRNAFTGAEISPPGGWRTYP